MGFERSHGRGVGTRNYIVVVGTNSKSGTCLLFFENRTFNLSTPLFNEGSYCKQLVKRIRDELGPGFHINYPNIDGVVDVTHTEGVDVFGRIN